MRAYIKATNDLRQAIKDKFGVSRLAIWRALNNLGTSERSTAIREYALTHGAKWTTEVNFVPTCKTEHLTNGGFVQSFSNGTSVTALGSHVEIRQGDDVIATFEHVTLGAWGSVLRIAQSLDEGKINKTDLAD